MGCKADFAANIWILARNSTKQTARVRVIARCEGLCSTLPQGMAQIAGQTGLSREQLYRSFSETGNPTLKTTLAVMKALGIELIAKGSAAA